MEISSIPKFLINLERRPDRLEKVKKELEYIGWEYNIFKAIDTAGYMGIALSILEVIKIAKENKYKRVMVIEDDITFMPYAKDLISKIESSCDELEFAIFNLAPTLNRPILVSKENNLLLDMTNLPEKFEHHRDFYGCNMVIFDESIYDEVEKIENTRLHGGGYYKAIDEFIFVEIISKFQSYCPVLPIAPQTYDYSDVSNGMYSNFYLQTYNWNGYSPIKIPSEFMDYENNQIIKKENTHKEFYYES